MARIERRYRESNRNNLDEGGFVQRPPFNKWRQRRLVPRPQRAVRTPLLHKPRLPWLPVR